MKAEQSPLRPDGVDGISTKSALKTAMRSTIAKAGWRLERVDSGKGSPRTPLETAMNVVLACQGRLRLVEVGANDGVVNDPCHDFVMEHRARTEILLIEPQPYLIPILEANYKDHPAHTTANLAVGSPGTLQLFVVDQRCWPDCRAPYAVDWPIYRAPTGVTSSDRSHVANWLKQHYQGEMPIDQSIETVKTESLPLVDIVDRTGFGRDIDVLQVDAEGFDDEVLYYSSLEILKPKIINFENQHLPAQRLRALADELARLGYQLESTGPDTMAVLTGGLR